MSECGSHRPVPLPFHGCSLLLPRPEVDLNPAFERLQSLRAKKDTQTQRFHPKIPCLDPPFLEAFNPRNSLCSGCVFPLKYRKSANTKNFEGGRGGQKKNLCVRFLWVFFPLFNHQNGQRNREGIIQRSRCPNRSFRESPFSQSPKADQNKAGQSDFLYSKWTRLFWGTDCRR